MTLPYLGLGAMREPQPPNEGMALISGSSRSSDIWYLRTTGRKWGALVVVAFVSCFSQIPIMAWQTLQPLMLDDGAFQCGAGDTREQAMAQLDVIFNVGLGLSAVAQLSQGLLFDAIGPRMLGVTSAICTVIGYFVLALALHYPCSYPGVIWISLLSFIAAPAQVLASNAYLYLLPENAFAVSAITNSAFVVAQAFGLAGGIMHASGLTSYLFFYVMSAITSIAIGVFYWLVPSQDDFSALQSEELAKQAGTVAGPPHKQERSLSHAIDQVWSSLRDAGTLVCCSPSFGCSGAVLVFHIFVLYMQQTFFLIEQFHYYDALFDEGSANNLVDLYAFIFAATGVPISILYGAIADMTPMWATVVSWDALALLFCVTTIVPTLWAQYASMTTLTVLTNVYFLAAPPFVMCYSPPELFGTLFGALMALNGTLQIGLVALEDSISMMMLPGEWQEGQRVAGKLLFWSMLIVVASVCNLCIWRRNPPPERGSVTLESIHELQRLAKAACSEQADASHSKK